MRSQLTFIGFNNIAFLHKISKIDLQYSKSIELALNNNYKFFYKK